MCGIVGYIGHREAAPLILESLRKLEYRGYDSAGIAVLHDGQVSDSPLRGQAQQSRNDAAAPADDRNDRHRPHALGNPWPAVGEPTPIRIAPAISWSCTTASSRTISSLKSN